ncbi:MAG: hypothetical protein FJ190_08005 [Gammaproteobacteria bacterium]|nr:hypothetical protein [Gammaproteobacteria bacterium]
MKYNIFLLCAIALMITGCLYPYSDRASTLLLADEYQRVEIEKQIKLRQEQEENEKAKRKTPTTVSDQ